MGDREMGPPSTAKARPSVMFPKGSAEYWDLKDQQEQQLLDTDSEGDDAPRPPGTPAPTPSSRKRPRTPRAAATPDGGTRKMRCLTAQRRGGAEAAWAAERQLVELAERDRRIDTAVQTRRTLELRLARQEEVLEEARRQHCLEATAKDKELKRMDAMVTEHAERCMEERRRRACLEEQLQEGKGAVAAERASAHQLRLRLADAEDRAAAAEARVRAAAQETATQADLARSLGEETARLQAELAAALQQRQASDAQRAEAEQRCAEREAGVAGQVEEVRRACGAEAAALKVRLETQLALAKASAEETARKLREAERPKEDNVLRGQVEELLRENSGVRTERREMETKLAKAGADSRRLERKYAALQKRVAEPSEAQSKVAELERQVKGLEARLEEFARSTPAEAPQGRPAADGSLPDDDAASDGAAVDDARESAEKVFGEILGWKLAKGKGRGVLWRVAPTDQAGRARWKCSELCVRRAADGALVAAASPLLAAYDAKAAEGGTEPRAGDVHPRVVISAMASDVVAGK